MGACRESMSIWLWLFNKRLHDWKGFFKRKIWRDEYFWHDSFGRYFNQLIRCKVVGHKRTWMGDGGCQEEKPHYYCFRCDKVIDCKKSSKSKGEPKQTVRKVE